MHSIASAFITALTFLGSFGVHTLPEPPQTFGALSILKASQGGTGIGTAALSNLGDCLVVTDDTPFTYALDTCSGGGTSPIATSSVPTVGQVAYWTGNGTPSTLGSVATGTVSGASVISVTAGRSALGGALAITTSGGTFGTGDYVFPDDLAVTATTTTLGFSVTGAVSILGEYFTNFTTYVRSLITCGRSLTCASGDISADPEIYTYGITANLIATSTANGISTTTAALIWKQVPVASTITGFECGVAPGTKTGTSTIRAVVATDAIGTGATDLLYATGINCGSQQNISTSTFSTTALNAGDWIGLYVSDASPTGSRPGRINAAFTVTKND